MSNSDVIVTKIENGIATVTLNRSSKKNAMNLELFESLKSEFNKLEDSVRVAIIAGAGGNFSSGLDLTDTGASSQLLLAGEMHPVSRAETTSKFVKLLQSCISSVKNSNIPTIAAINGACIGAGLDLAAACDIRLATRSSYISLREVKMGMVADLGSLQRLTMAIPSGWLHELAYTGKNVSAELAKEIGLVNHIYDDEDSLLVGALKLAEDIASNAPLALKATKKILRELFNVQIEKSLGDVAFLNSLIMYSEDVKEAFLSFMEKRLPEFKGK